MSTTDHMLEKLRIASQQRRDERKYGEAYSIEMAAQELRLNLLRSGDDHAGYALGSTVNLLQSLSKDSHVEPARQAGYLEAAELIEAIADSYGFYEDQPASFFQRSPADPRKSVLDEVREGARRDFSSAPVKTAESTERTEATESASTARLQGLLQSAEAELFDWVSGVHSSLSAQIAVEATTEDRSLTLLRTVQQDAAELELATRRVEALRLLLSSRSDS